MGIHKRDSRLVFIRTDRLGETLLNLPAVAALGAGYPNASIVLVVHPDLQPLLSDLPGVDEVLAAPIASRAWWRRSLELARLLRRYQFELAVVSNPKKELHLAVWLAGIKQRVGYGRKWGGLLTHRLDDRKRLGDRHEVEYNLQLVQALGVLTSGVPHRFPQLEQERREVRELLERQGMRPSEPFVTIHPWTSNPIKQWPPDRFRLLIERVCGDLGVRVVVVGGAEHRPDSRAVVPDLGGVWDSTGQLTLRQLAALLQQTNVLVSNDSGPVHLAAMGGTATIVLFGTTVAAASPVRWGPWGLGHQVLAGPTMESISVDDVLAAVRRQLARQPHPSETSGGPAPA